MDGALTQTVVTGLLVLGAAIFLARRAWRSIVASRRATANGATCGSDGGCGCAPGRDSDDTLSGASQR